MKVEKEDRWLFAQRSRLLFLKHYPKADIRRREILVRMQGRGVAGGFARPEEGAAAENFVGGDQVLRAGRYAEVVAPL